MSRTSMFIVLFCTLFFFSFTMSQSKFRKLESMLNLLQSKLTMLENKVFKDELDFRDDLDMILKQLNNSKDKNQDETGNFSDTGFTSTNDDELLRVLEKVRTFQDGFEKEKQYIRNQLKLFEAALDDMKHQQTKAISEFTEKSDKRLVGIENQVLAGKEFMIQNVENIKNETVFIKLSIYDDIEILSTSKTAMKHEMEELKEDNARNKMVLAELSVKFENVEKATNKMNEAPFLDCATWDRFGLSCYKFFDDEVEWEVAVEKCKLEDAFLVEIESSVENSHVVNLTTTRAVDEDKAITDIYEYAYNYYYNFYLGEADSRSIGPWLGASDKQTEGKWVWEYSGRNLDKAFQGWNDGEPNGKSRENCLHLHEKLDYK
ncbi:uncharacterized protein LOC123550814 [Mercenaria mercenaria]|uniref:uncharacterized protein LOC123550814 n=1 Tax=Mercenaria mercenaria TaxID=6596 RepID=UPI00234F8041|nr:uncharacterized protein LOC123550814 [Mercenaria mercenaria]